MRSARPAGRPPHSGAHPGGSFVAVPGDPRVIVIGAGIVGASVAMHLGEAGADVVVVDDARPGRATLAGAGIVAAPWRRGEPRDPAFLLAARAFDAYSQLAPQLAEHGAPAPLETIGQLFVAEDEAQLDTLQARLGSLAPAERGRLGSVERIGSADARRAFPYLRDGLAALHVSGTARVDGEAVREALMRHALRLGAHRVPGPAQLRASGARVDGAIVAGEALGADAVVVAAGAWSADILRVTGVGIGVEPQRGQILHLALPGARTAHLPAVQPLLGEHYLLPFPDSRVVAGATRETGAGFDPRPTAAGIATVLAQALELAPGLGDATLREVRVGLRPSSLDGMPVLGALPGHANVLVATGMGASGLTLGPYCGMLVADMVLGRATDPVWAAFAPGRPQP